MAKTCLRRPWIDPSRHQYFNLLLKRAGIHRIPAAGGVSGELAVPSVVAYEIEYGTLKIGSLRRRALAYQLLAGLAQVPFDHEAAWESARIRFELEAGGMVIGPVDLLIAGTALSRKAALVTSNTKEFSRVKGLRLLDWTR